MNKIKTITIYLLTTIIMLSIINSYTNKIKDKDPIMKKININKDKHSKKAINAKIIGNKIISGKNGVKVNKNKTYYKMKQYGNYNESLYILEEIKPVISIYNNYDKYIVKGNSNNRNISIIFIINNSDELIRVIELLKGNKINATLFINGSIIENNINIIKNNLNHEYELLNYNNTNNKSLYKTALSYLENITNTKKKYCLNINEDNNYLDLCKSLKLFSIKPTLYIDNNLYSKIKTNLTNSIIIALTLNKKIEEELPTTINYIKRKGYNITTLKDVINE